MIKLLFSLTPIGAAIGLIRIARAFDRRAIRYTVMDAMTGREYYRYV